MENFVLKATLTKLLDNLLQLAFDKVCWVLVILQGQRCNGGELAI